MLIFKIFKIRKMIREGREDPGKLAGSEAGELIIGAVILPVIIAVIFLAIIFLFGFTSVLGGPFLLGRIIFYIALIPSIIFFIIIWKTVRFIKKLSRKVVDQTINVTSKVVE